MIALMLTISKILRDNQDLIKISSSLRNKLGRRDARILKLESQIKNLEEIVETKSKLIDEFGGTCKKVRCFSYEEVIAYRDLLKTYTNRLYKVYKCPTCKSIKHPDQEVWHASTAINYNGMGDPKRRKF